MACADSVVNVNARPMAIVPFSLSNYVVGASGILTSYHGVSCEEIEISHCYHLLGEPLPHNHTCTNTE